MGTISEIRTVEKRLRAASTQLYATSELARSIGTYTTDRFRRAASCLSEAADCMSYITGNIESYMLPEEREAAMLAILDAMAGKP